MSEKFANNAQSTLSTGIDNDDTTVTVADGSVYPATGNFRIKIGTELMLCTARSTNDLTVTRGIEGTSAASHSSGVNVTHIVTAGALDALKDDIRYKSVTALKTANYTVLATDDVVPVGTLSGTITITLPASPASGQTHVVKDANGSAGSFNITVDGNGANIDSAATFVMTVNYTSLTVCWTGSKWSII